MRHRPSRATTIFLLVVGKEVDALLDYSVLVLFEFDLLLVCPTN